MSVLPCWDWDMVIFESHLVYFFLVCELIVSHCFDNILPELQQVVWSMLSEVFCTNVKVSLSLSTQNSEAGSFMEISLKDWVQLSETEKFVFSLIKSGLLPIFWTKYRRKLKGNFWAYIERKRHAPDMLCFHKLWWLHADQLIIVL